MESINKYIEATQHHLGVEGERYGSGYRAIVAPRPSIEFLFGKLEGDDLDGTEAQSFFAENPLFPSAWGETVSEALEKLNAKLAILYHLEASDSVYKWRAEPKFSLLANYDPNPGKAPLTYQVSWADVVDDLFGHSAYFYEAAKASCSATHKRDLHALLNFNYEGEFSGLRDI